MCQSLAEESWSQGRCFVVRSLLFIRIGIALELAWIAAACAHPAQADTLTITYNVSPNQTAVVGSGFTVVDFAGSVTNDSRAAITFQLTAVLHDFEPYVASFVDGIPFPGITLSAGASTGIIDLAIITLQPFDPSLSYPGKVGIALQAIDPMSGSVFAENDASI